MKRSVVKHGPSTYIISLPIKWVKENNIEKGSELEVTEELNKIIISKDIGEKKDSEAEVDITDMDRTLIIHVVRGFYRLGYDTLTIKFNNLITSYQRIKEKVSVLSVIHTEVNRLIGYEIIEEKEKSCVIKDLQGVSEKEFDPVLRRIFFLLMNMSNDFIEGIKTNNHSLLETIEHKHDTITKFVSYCLRILNKKGYIEPKKTLHYYHIIVSLDIIVDIMKYAAQNIRTKDIRIKSEVLSILEIVDEDLRNYHNLFYDYSIPLIVKINTNRYTAEKTLRNLSDSTKPKEVMVATSMFHILEILLDLVEARTALDY